VPLALVLAEPALGVAIIIVIVVFTLVMPAARLTTDSPPTTQGMPEAPSAASWERLRRPIIIMMPQNMRPATPLARPAHFNQPRKSLANFSRPGGATGGGLGAAAARAAR